MTDQEMKNIKENQHVSAEPSSTDNTESTPREPELISPFQVYI